MQGLSPEQLQQIASTFGTPVYVYHAERIKSQYERLIKAFSGSDARFFYAAKALTNLSILRYIRELGCAIDCSSINEVKLAVQAGFPPADILYTSNNISFEEIEEAKKLGVHINIDSISNLRKFGQHFGHAYPVGVRLRPNIMAGGNLKISTGHAASKFGVPLEDIQQVLEVQKETGLFIRTLHIHTGSEIGDVEVFAKGIEVLFDAQRPSKDWPHDNAALTFLRVGVESRRSIKVGVLIKTPPSAASETPFTGVASTVLSR